MKLWGIWHDDLERFITLDDISGDETNGKAMLAFKDPADAQAFMDEHPVDILDNDQCMVRIF